MAVGSKDVEVDVEYLNVEEHVRVDVVPQVHGGVPKLGNHGLQIHHLQAGLYMRVKLEKA